MLYEKDKDFVRFERVHTSQNLYHLWKVPSSATELKLIHFIVKSLTLVPQNVQDMLILWSVFQRCFSTYSNFMSDNIRD